MKSNHAKLLAILLVYALTNHFVQAAPHNAMNKDVLNALLTGNTIIGTHLNKGFKFDMYLKRDGTLIEKREDRVIAGTWRVNDKGKFCWNYKHKEKTWCLWVINNGDRTYTNVKKKNGSLTKVRQFKVFDGNIRSLYLPR